MSDTMKKASISIRVLGAHSSESQKARCISFLINDNLAIDAGGLTSTLPVSAQCRIKWLLLTHQHFDHIKDLPALALNCFHAASSMTVVCTDDTMKALKRHIFNGSLFPKFYQIPSAKPTLQFEMIEPYLTRPIGEFEIMAVPMEHPQGSIGYSISNSEGKSVFYTGDTGPGLSRCWKLVSPRLLITEVTLPDSYKDFALSTRHLTPRSLGVELVAYKTIKGDFPKVVVTHMYPEFESQIAEEIKFLSDTLGVTIEISYEGMRIEI